jgi:hypothetical protein
MTIFVQPYREKIWEVAKFTVDKNLPETKGGWLKRLLVNLIVKIFINF